MKKKILIALSGLTFVFGLSSIIYFYGPWWFTKVHDYDDRYGTVGSIELPKGYERVNDGTGFDEYLRDLPLASEDVQVRRITGELADTLNPYCYRVVNLPLMHHYEQCADVCMRLRAEYLFRTRQLWKIHFISYMIKVYNCANTESMVHEMPQRRLSDMQPGDVFVYCAKDRADKEYGHAIMVADVARNPVTGRKIFLLLQGSTPACSIHILKNRNDSVLSPWFELDENASTLDLGIATYQANELRHFCNSIFSHKDPSSTALHSSIANSTR